MCICDLSAGAFDIGGGWGRGVERVDRLDMSCYLTALVTIVGHQRPASSPSAASNGTMQLTFFSLPIFTFPLLHWEQQETVNTDI